MGIINWKYTNDKLKAELKSNGIGTRELAKRLNISDRMIQYWFNNSNDKHPSMEQMYMICLCLGKKLDDIVVMDYEEALREVELLEAESSNRIDDSEKTYVEEYFSENIKKSVDDELILKSKYHIRTLEELLLYLPLVNIQILTDMLFRIQGDTYRRMDYVYICTESMYKSIKNDETKEFADLYREFYLQYPSIELLVNEGKTDSQKYLRFREVYDSGRLQKLQMAYIEKLNEFYKVTHESLMQTKRFVNFFVD